MKKKKYSIVNKSISERLSCFIVKTSVPVVKNSKEVSEGKEKIYRCVASSVFIPNLIGISGDVFENMIKNKTVKKYIFILILDIEGEDYGIRFISNIKDLSYREYSFDLVTVQPKEFFTSGFLWSLFENKYISYNNVFFGFMYYDWNKIISEFRKVKIEISGGANVKRHLYSPIQNKLGKFLSCYFDFDKVNKIVNESFENVPKGTITREAGVDLKNVKILDLKYPSSVLSSNTDRTNISLIQKFNKGLFYNDPKFLEKTQLEMFDYSSKFFTKAIEENSNSKRRYHTCVIKRDDNNTDIPEPLNKTDTINLITANLKKLTEEKYQESNKIKNITNNRRGEACFHTSIIKKQDFKGEGLIEAPKPVNKDEKINLNSHGPVENQISSIKSQIVNSQLFNFLDLVKNLIETSVDKKKTQLKLENSWIELIQEKLENVDYFTQHYKGTLLANLIQAEKTLDTWYENNYLNKKFPKFKDELNKLEFLILTFALCITFYDKINYNALAVKIGNDILYRIFLNRIKSKTTLHSSFTQFKDSLNIGLKEKAVLGDFFMSIFIMYPHDIFKRDIHTDSYWTNEPSSLKLNETNLDQIKENIVISATSLPMVSRPKIWSDKVYGGYLTNSAKQESIITGSKNHNHKMDNKENLYKAINTLNKIKFGINNKFLDYINNEGKFLLDEVEAENKLQRMLILKVAETYRNIPFYLPTNADWRGRIYCQSFWITYQGGDLTTALLNFWKGERITESQKLYLHIYGANNHNENNISKKSLKERLRWIKNNYERIINLDKELILKAENPFIFTAFCLNMKELDINPKAKLYTPVFLDATCSGIQHLTALLKDVELASEVNMIENDEDQDPKDIYSTLLEPINYEINKFGLDNIEYGVLANVKLDRSIVKRNIMTKVYNVSKYGMANQLKEKLAKVERKPDNNTNIVYKVPTIQGGNISLSNKDIYQVARIIDEQIFIRFPSLNYIYIYFIEITKLMSRLGLQMSWVTPAGLEISQKYLKSKTTTIGVALFNKTKKMVFREWLDKLDNRKQALAIIPNVIHSLDATHLINLINEAEKEKFGPIITIHDCFGTLPSKMEELDYRVKKEFVLLYTQQNFLNTFHNRIIQTIKDNNIEIEKHEDGNSYIIIKGIINNIPNPPKQGDLDLKNIMNSKYLIT